jgi:hypothetical protein
VVKMREMVQDGDDYVPVLRELSTYKKNHKMKGPSNTWDVEIHEWRLIKHTEFEALFPAGSQSDGTSFLESQELVDVEFTGKTLRDEMDGAQSTVKMVRISPRGLHILKLIDEGKDYDEPTLDELVPAVIEHLMEHTQRIRRKLLQALDALEICDEKFQIKSQFIEPFPHASRQRYCALMIRTGVIDLLSGREARERGISKRGMAKGVLLTELGTAVLPEFRSSVAHSGVLDEGLYNNARNKQRCHEAVQRYIRKRLSEFSQTLSKKNVNYLRRQLSETAKHECKKFQEDDRISDIEKSVCGCINRELDELLNSLESTLLEPDAEIAERTLLSALEIDDE